MNKIQKLEAKTILDSRGNPTIEVFLTLDSKTFKASVPSGASTGAYEAVELRDKDGGVKQAIKNINEIIAPELVGQKIDQKKIDELMIKIDGTENKSRLGGNAICAVSLVACRAGAAIHNLELFQYVKEIFKKDYGYSIDNIPIPSFNIINGGSHANNGLDVQEFMIMPLEGSFCDQLKEGKRIFNNLKGILSRKYGDKGLILGDEGGFAPQISKAEDAINLILRSCQDKKTGIVLDVAATEFFKNGKYHLEGEKLNQEDLIAYYSVLAKKYPIVGIEDPFAEDDWQGFRKLTNLVGDQIAIIGDDLLVTNPERIRKAHKEKSVNAALLKINQIGTVSEALHYAQLAYNFDWKIMVSHRSGETMDDFIADFAVGIGADFIKSGAPSKKERLVKYNRILDIVKSCNL